MLKIFFDAIIDFVGALTICGIVFLLTAYLVDYIRKVMAGQTKIKCLCKHEYEPHSAWHMFYNSEYKFKCRKCGKVILVKTVSDSEFRFRMIKNEE